MGLTVLRRSSAVGALPPASVRCRRGGRGQAPPLRHEDEHSGTRCRRGGPWAARGDTAKSVRCPPVARAGQAPPLRHECECTAETCRSRDRLPLRPALSPRRAAAQRAGAEGRGRRRLRGQRQRRARSSPRRARRARAGVEPGMTLPQARARVPKLVARGRDRECERASQEALLEVAEMFSPRVEDEGEGVVYLDLEGIRAGRRGRSRGRRSRPRPRHPARGGEGAPARARRRRGVQARGARRGGPARHADRRARRRGDALPRAAAAREARPRARDRRDARPLGPPLDRRFREAARGRSRQPPRREPAASSTRPRAASTRARSSPTFRRRPSPRAWTSSGRSPRSSPSSSSRTPRSSASSAASSRRPSRARAWKSRSSSTPTATTSRAIALPAPTRDVKTLLTLVRLELEARPPGAPVAGFTFSAHPDSPRRAQLSLFGPAALSPDRLATTIARLAALLGADRVGSPRAIDGHRPERFTDTGYAPPPPPHTRLPPREGRGLLGVRVLRPAVALEVLTSPGAEGRGSSPPARARS